MEAITLKKQKTLTGIITDLPLGASLYIKNSEYKIISVRGIVHRLRKKGVNVEATERGVIDGIIITRLR